MNLAILSNPANCETPMLHNLTETKAKCRRMLCNEPELLVCQKISTKTADAVFNILMLAVED